MEIDEPPKQDEQALPSLFRVMDQVAGFDCTAQHHDNISDQQPQTGSPFLSPTIRENETAIGVGHGHTSQANVSISMPPTPYGHNLHSPNRVFFLDHAKQVRDKFHSQSIPNAGDPHVFEGSSGRSTPQHPHEPQLRNPQVARLRENRYDSFKTWSGKLERQLTRASTLLGGRAPEARPESRLSVESEALPVDRYFDALEGPELDTLRQSEELMLPEDRTWPFLLRFQVASFGICLGISSQAILWKTLASSPSTSFLHISLTVNLVLWSISVALLVGVTLIYALKLMLYFEAVRREYYHPIRINFFFAPFIALLFLALGVPPSVAKTLPYALWYVLMIPFLCLELKIYGQWMSGGQRRLSKVANPSNHLSLVGNFVGSLLGASMGLKEGPLFFFAVGLAHYIVLFVTLYQRLPTNETLPKDLHPVFFLFVAGPSVASMAWANIQGSFDYGSRIAYFIGLFLYVSLAVRINFFRGFRFSLAWWAYTFPMTGAAIATIRYSNEVTNWVTRSLAIFLSLVAILVVTSLLATTLTHAFVYRRLFPNDIAIAISDRPPRPHTRNWPFHLRHGGSDTNAVEHYLKFVHSTTQDLESSLESSVANPTANGKL